MKAICLRIGKSYPSPLSGGMKAKVISVRIFDGEARGYDAWYDTKLGRFVDEVETKLAFDMLRPLRGQCMLDVGCGTGNFSFKLVGAGCTVTGIDVSKNMLEKARSKADTQEVSFLEMDAHELDFPGGTFDGVISMAVFEFLERPEQALDEMLRVVKPGGHVVVGTINRDSPWGKLYTGEGMKDSVYRYAKFKTKEYMGNLRKDCLVHVKTCLFVPPTVQEDRLSVELENKLSLKNEGGFICTLWKKR